MERGLALVRDVRRARRADERDGAHGGVTSTGGRGTPCDRLICTGELDPFSAGIRTRTSAPRTAATSFAFPLERIERTFCTTSGSWRMPRYVVRNAARWFESRPRGSRGTGGGALASGGRPRGRSGSGVGVFGSSPSPLPSITASQEKAPGRAPHTGFGTRPGAPERGIHQP